MLYDENAKENRLRDQVIQAAAIFVCSVLLIILFASFFFDAIDSLTIVITAPAVIAAVFMSRSWTTE